MSSSDSDIEMDTFDADVREVPIDLPPTKSEATSSTTATPAADTSSATSAAPATAPTLPAMADAKQG